MCLTGQQHRPMYFPQIGFNSDDQHTNLLNLPSGLQFNWSFPGKAGERAWSEASACSLCLFSTVCALFITLYDPFSWT